MDNVISVDLKTIWLQIVQREKKILHLNTVSTEKQQTESSVGTKRPSRKRKASEIDIFDFDISPKKRRLGTREIKTTIRRKSGRKPYCFFCKSDSHTPRSCTEMVAENSDKMIPSDES